MTKSSDPQRIILKEGERHIEPLMITLTGKETCIDIILGADASATMFDTSSSLKHSVTVTLGARSSLSYISLSTNSERHFASSVGENASMHFHCTTIGGSHNIHTLVSRCIEPNAKSDIDWIFSVRNSERQAVTARNIFAARNGGGEITLKGVAQQKAHAVCNGMIEITEEGTGTDTYLTEDVLMLDATAKVDAIPGLEIRTNDVKASHSATVSRVTAEDLFYLQARGIDERTARSMFVDGFLSDLTDSISDRTIQAQVIQTLSEALDQVHS